MANHGTPGHALVDHLGGRRDRDLVGALGCLSRRDLDHRHATTSPRRDAHDATHYLLYKNRVVNDMVCDALIAFPLGLSTDLYRATHFRHHLYTNTADDPDLQYQKDDPDWFNWPKSNWKTRWVILKSFLGLNLHKAYKPLKMWSPWMNIGLPLEGKPKYPLRSRILLVVSTVLIYALVIGQG